MDLNLLYVSTFIISLIGGCIFREVFGRVSIYCDRHPSIGKWFQAHQKPVVIGVLIIAFIIALLFYEPMPITIFPDPANPLPPDVLIQNIASLHGIGISCLVMPGLHIRTLIAYTRTPAKVLEAGGKGGL